MGYALGRVETVKLGNSFMPLPFLDVRENVETSVIRPLSPPAFFKEAWQHKAIA